MADKDLWGYEDHPMANTDSATIMALKREVGDLKGRVFVLVEALDTIKYEAGLRLNSSKDDTWAVVFNKALAALKATGEEKVETVNSASAEQPQK